MNPAFKAQEERDAYESLAAELKRGFRVDVLWIKALVDAQNDRGAAEVLYARWRVGELIERRHFEERERAARLAQEAKLREDQATQRRPDFHRQYPEAFNLPDETIEELFRDWLDGTDVTAAFRSAQIAKEAKDRLVRNIAVAFLILFLVAVIVSVQSQK